MRLYRYTVTKYDEGAEGRKICVELIQQFSEIKDGMERLAKLAQEAYQSQNIDLRISYNEKADRFIYKGINPETGEVIREYPPEEVIKRIVTLKKIAGLIVDTTS